MRTRRGFTLVEILVTLGIIAALAAILLPALSAVRGSANMAKSQTNMRQTFALMRDYAVANRDTIVPSLFDYSDTSVTPVQGKVRTDTTIPAGSRNRGTWADILWTQGGFGPVLYQDAAGADITAYRTYAPDGDLYKVQPDFNRGPFRAAVASGKLYHDGQVGVGDATPFAAPISQDTQINTNVFGSRLSTRTEPGLFAANNFFDSRPAAARAKTNHPYDARIELSSASGTYFNYGQILSPETAGYLIDSTAGTTIDPVDLHDQNLAPFDADDKDVSQVAFRYPGGTTNILLLDGHVKNEVTWDELSDLEGLSNERDAKTGARIYEGDPAKANDNGRGVRFRHLDLR